MTSASDLLGVAETRARLLGIPRLRDGQRAVLRTLAMRRAVLACLPTGYGKSACFLLPAAAWGWRVWVISPLLSLMEDQAQACRSLGLRALAFTPNRPREALLAELEAGSWQVCLLSPERLLRWHESGYLAQLAGMGLDADLLAIDEMHCLEDWRGFRAGYEALAEPVRRLTDRGTILLGLSASLAESAGRAWMRELAGRFRVVSAGLGRENLRLRVLAVEEEEERWLALVSALRGLREPATALVYCSSRSECDAVARFLRSAGYDCVAYHAGLPAEERAERVRAFRAGRLRVVCATIAFGMGVDYPHVDRVLHFSLPRDLEGYWQEVGRAGRGGQEAWGIALWRRSEIARARGMSARERERFAALWDAWAQPRCRRQVVAERLGFTEPACGKCDQCAGPDVVPWLGEWGAEPWWARDPAQLRSWVREKILAYSRER